MGVSRKLGTGPDLQCLVAHQSPPSGSRRPWASLTGGHPAEQAPLVNPPKGRSSLPSSVELLGQWVYDPRTVQLGFLKAAALPNRVFVGDYCEFVRHSTPEGIGR
jgi:hypothetical protein